MKCTGHFPYSCTGDFPYNTGRRLAVRSITPQTGGSPDPGDVLGRDDVILRLVDAARRGNNHLLSDPRRMGKTSLLIRLCNEPGPEVTAIKIDLEGCASVDEVVVRILGDLRQLAPLKDRAKSLILQSLDGGSAEVSVGPLTLSKTAKVAGSLATLESCVTAIDEELDEGQLVVVALDEVTIAADSIARREPEECHRLLQTLRHLRGDANPSVRWILSGSIGFHHVLRRAAATEGLVNDLTPVELGPLAPIHAGQLATALFAGIGREANDDVIGHVVALTDGIPFMLHNAVHRLAGSTASVAVDEAAEAFESYLADRGQSGAWTHLVSRIDTYYENASLATAVLDARAIRQVPMSFDELCALCPGVEPDDMRQLIDHLVDDHYLDDRTLTWRYDVLRDTWMLRRRLNAEAES